MGDSHPSFGVVYLNILLQAMWGAMVGATEEDVMRRVKDLVLNACNDRGVSEVPVIRLEVSGCGNTIVMGDIITVGHSPMRFPSPLPSGGNA